MKGRRHITFNAILVLCIANFVNGACRYRNTVRTNIKNTVNKTSDISLNVTQLISQCGYPAEEHHVQTADGYILTVNRIPSTGPVVFLMHGLLNSAEDFLTLGPEDCLACLLAKENYDVWLGNARGNKYSRKNINISPDKKAFWNFTFHETGVYDLPAMIDYVLAKSKRRQLTYVGHSQGTTDFYVMASERPDYGKKVSLMISMASTAWISHLKSPVIRALVPFRYLEDRLLQTLRLYEFLPYDGLWKFLTTQFCPSSRFSMKLCASVVFSAYGYDFNQLDYLRFASELGHLPAGVSLKTILHLAQLIASKTFRQFDYRLKNTEVYGSVTPPSYSVQNITVPIAILYAENDWLSSFQDVETLINILPNVIDVYKVPYDLFNHMDYLWAKDAKGLVYLKILQLIKAANKQ